ncbi:hypothetical protein [Gordonia sp. NPDC127522]|uniref:hypothetical protein n=1 Tax=Gordonia sp. NPDC127522 TaxID=3345390 RepID=UPI00362EAAE3
MSDQEMIDEIAKAELVLVLNADLNQSNSGVALVALSVDRPVATRRVCVTEALADEAGPGWVVFLNEDLSRAEALRDALHQVRTARMSTTPSLNDRDWPSVAAQYATVFTSHDLRDVGRRWTAGSFRDVEVRSE